MQRKMFLKTLAAPALAAMALCAVTAHAQAPVEVPFYYPVAVGGPITKVIDGYAADFNKAHPQYKVVPIYAGTYQETIVKALTAHKSGKAPATSVLLSTDMFTLIDEDAIAPIDDFVKTDADRAWLKGFYPAFMANSQTGGKTWGVPFQRSTVVMYYNKDAFKEAGLDPHKAPQNWKELKEAAHKLTKKDASGNVTPGTGPHRGHRYRRGSHAGALARPASRGRGPGRWQRWVERRGRLRAQPGIPGRGCRAALRYRHRIHHRARAGAARPRSQRPGCAPAVVRARPAFL